jgi:hypothetical protein
MQNKSHAVMAQRTEGRQSLDDFPTPAWATRALIEHVIGRDTVINSACLEPACGRGHMSVALGEYFKEVKSHDVFDYGFGDVLDFHKTKYAVDSFDWVITNPPFRLAEEFIVKSLPIARVGVAMLVRTVFIESVGRYERLFQPHPPARVAQFTERVPMVKGRVDKKASTATGYAWIVWDKSDHSSTSLVWIPRSRRNLERDGDYVQAPVMRVRQEQAVVLPMRKIKEADLFSS